MSVSGDLGPHVEACRVVIAGSIVASQLPYGYNSHKMTPFGVRKGIVNHEVRYRVKA
ncbi:hypothetical protein Acife_2143 [Acidithiobacillus ferrivorans SS3]|uniref:Uncharacterized protein n=1 Tax=Acidithiobacillus ferrivorans SS3 TaxID=743299 RepID=G0JN44_9PROT|nr:hypothetical protein Acife_2143 [Acidithiobacillus ferrivorans SS3]